MVSDECKECCRNAGMLAERIICLTDYYDDQGEKYKMTAYYNALYEDKDNFIQDMREAADDIIAELRHISTDDLKILHDTYGISVMEYGENIKSATFDEKYDNAKARRCAKALEELVIDMLYFEIADDIKYRRIVKGDQAKMRRNIDVLKEMEKEITEFEYEKDEIALILDAEECDLCTLYDTGDSSVTEIKKHILKIADLFEEFTDDYLSMLEYEGFDSESYRWCAGKIRHNEYEIVNYMDSFTEAIESLNYIVHESIRGYKVLTEVAYDGGTE